MFLLVFAAREPWIVQTTMATVKEENGRFMKNSADLRTLGFSAPTDARKGSRNCFWRNLLGQMAHHDPGVEPPSLPRPSGEASGGPGAMRLEFLRDDHGTWA